MKFISKHYKKMKIAYIKTAGFAAVVTAFFLPHYQKLESTGDNLFIVSLNGEEVGVMGDLEEVDSCLIAARREIAGCGVRLTTTALSLRIWRRFSATVKEKR